MNNRKNQKGEITWQQNYYAYGIVVMPGAAKDCARITENTRGCRDDREFSGDHLSDTFE